MLKVKKTVGKSGSKVSLTGTCDEFTTLERIIGPVKGDLEVDCSEVTRMTSAGVREWILYFEDIKRQGVKFKFSNCSPAVVEQINCFSNFSCGGEIVSIHLPYMCSECDHEFLSLEKIADPSLITNHKSRPCPKCKAKADFDDEPKEYFQFLSRQKAA